MKTTRTMQFRRRKENKTNYAKRLAMLKSGKNRVLFRKSNKRITMQLISYEETSDKTLASTYSDKLKQFGFEGKCNLPSAYLTGYWLGKLALAAGTTEAIFDAGIHMGVLGGRAAAALKGVIDSGLKVPAEAKAFPREDRLEGKHIETKGFQEAKSKIDSLNAGKVKE